MGSLDYTCIYNIYTRYIYMGSLDYSDDAWFE